MKQSHEKARVSGAVEICGFGTRFRGVLLLPFIRPLQKADPVALVGKVGCVTSYH